MTPPIHIAITRRVRQDRVEDFKHLLAEFAQRSLGEPGTLGVHCLHPPPGAASREFGILRSFATEHARDAFYETPLYKEWVRRIEPMVEGEAEYRQLSGLEAWFRDTKGPMPPRWKMALLTWMAVWPISTLVPSLLRPILAPVAHPLVFTAIVSASIVVTLTWFAMPALVRLSHSWLHSTPHPAHES
ncbi:MAG: antibiotic biosynthesis monooxygenase [Verrucomicrobiae bacterium]|nr:antibiotic biosynthesis monooxygenase [Verrucomicrobiae bacterium]